MAEGRAITQCLQSVVKTEKRMNVFWKAKLNCLDSAEYTKKKITFRDICMDEEQLLVICKQLPEEEIGASPGTVLARYCDLLLAGECGTHVVKMIDQGCLALNKQFKSATGVVYSLFHVACACADSSLWKYFKEMKKSGNGGEMWSEKDSYGCTPDLIYSKKKVNLFGSVPKTDVVKLIADPDCFYPFVRMVQTCNINVNDPLNEDRDTLVHLVVRGGVSFLPHLLMLLNHWKAKPDVPNRKGLTPLCVAGQSGSDGLAEILICLFKADPNYSNKKDHNRTPLHYSAAAGCYEVTEVLLRRGADPVRYSNEDGNCLTPEAMAMMNKHTQVADLISSFSIQRADMLTEQIRTGDLDVASLFHGDHSSNNSSGKTLLMSAVEYNQPKLVEALLKHSSVNVSVKNFRNSENQQTVVSIACQKNHCECLKVLLKNGCSSHLTIYDSSHLLPIDYAAANDCVECVKLIIDDQKGLVGLNDLVEDSLNISGNVRKILIRGRNKRQKEIVKPALFEAARTGSLEGIQKVFEVGDDICPRNESGESPLAVAAKYGNVDVIRWLESNGARLCPELDGNPKGNFNNCLHNAASSGNLATVIHILDHMEKSYALLGDSRTSLLRKINERNETGFTALEIAASSGHKDIVKVLVDHKASTCVPDTTGKLLTCQAYDGIQFELEQMRNAHLEDVIRCINSGSLMRLREIWQNPYDHNLRTLDGETMLMMAAGYGTVDVLRYILDTLGDMELEKEPASIILSKCPESGGSILVCYLRERNISSGRAAVHYAVVHKKKDNLRLILRRDPTSANLIDNDGNSAAHLAAMSRSKKMVQILMDAGASMAILNGKKLYPDQLMGKSSLTRSMEQSRKLECSMGQTV